MKIFELFANGTGFTSGICLRERYHHAKSARLHSVRSIMGEPHGIEAILRLKYGPDGAEPGNSRESLGFETHATLRTFNRLHTPVRPGAAVAPQGNRYVTLSGPAVVSPTIEARLAEAVSASVGATRFTLWFGGLARFEVRRGEVVVVVRNRHSLEWMEQAFGTAVNAAANEVCGERTAVRWLVEAEPEPDVPVNRISTLTEPVADEVAVTTTQTKTHSRSEPSPHVDLFGEAVPTPKPKPSRPNREAEMFTKTAAVRPTRRWKPLSEFVVGPSNRVAHASALSVVEDPAGGANPLVIHGPVGTGKTHLLEGIYIGLRKNWADSRPCYVTAEEFTNRFVQAMRLGKLSAFRRQYRECSALILDDLHFLATKRATQEEFLHTLDCLMSDGRQVVVTTDCHPRLADELMPELTDRLLGGAVWGLLPPEPDTRLEILRHKSIHAHPAIPDEVLRFVASYLRGNVRELEGAVNSVRHFARVTGRPVDLAVVKEALGDLLRHAVRVVTLDDVEKAVCSVLRLPAGTLQSKGRNWAVSHPRMIATYLCRKHTAATYGEISKHFAAKTHSTAVASEKKVRDWLDRDISVAIGDREWRAKDLIDRIERELQR